MNRVNIQKKFRLFLNVFLYVLVMYYNPNNCLAMVK